LFQTVYHIGTALLGSPFMAGYFGRPFLLVQLFSRSYEKLIQNVTIYAVNIYILYIVYHIGTALLVRLLWPAIFDFPTLLVYIVFKNDTIYADKK